MCLIVLGCYKKNSSANSMQLLPTARSFGDTVIISFKTVRHITSTVRGFSESLSLSVWQLYVAYGKQHHIIRRRLKMTGFVSSSSNGSTRAASTWKQCAGIFWEHSTRLCAKQWVRSNGDTGHRLEIKRHLRVFLHTGTLTLIGCKVERRQQNNEARLLWNVALLHGCSRKCFSFRFVF